MTKVMVTIQSLDEAPTLEAVIERYRLGPDDVDEGFGVVEIDPDDHLFVILVEPEAANRIQPTEGWEVAGPYSNPRIEPFGPPEAVTPPHDHDDPGHGEVPPHRREP